jgi:hypothetical protein
MTIEITSQQARVLDELLEHAHREKLREVHRTDALGYKRILDAEIQAIEDLRLKLVEARQTV